MDSPVKALVYEGPGVIKLSDLPVPVPGPGEVLLRVLAAGVCGSDVNGFQGRSKARVPPLVLGHEFSAQVVEAPPGRLPVGARVAVFPLVGCARADCPACGGGHPNRCPRRTLMGLHRPGAFSEFVVAPAAACHLLPDSVSDVAGALVEPLANAVHLIDAVLRLNGAVRRIAIIGGGGQGLMALALARHAGIACLVVEPDADRRARATVLGAAEVVDPYDEDEVGALVAAAQRDGFEAVIDTAGFASSRRLATQIAAAGGTVLYLGLHDQSSTSDDLAIINRELTIVGSYAYTSLDFQRAVRLAEQGGIGLDAFGTAIPLSDGVAVFSTLTTAPGRLIKAVLVPEGAVR